MQNQGPNSILINGNEWCSSAFIAIVLSSYIFPIWTNEYLPYTMDSGKNKNACFVQIIPKLLNERQLDLFFDGLWIGPLFLFIIKIYTYNASVSRNIYLFFRIPKIIAIVKTTLIECISFILFAEAWIPWENP